jgi:hypothetical protein
MSELLVDRAGRRRSAATMPGFHVGRPPRNDSPFATTHLEESLRSSSQVWDTECSQGAPERCLDDGDDVLRRQPAMEVDIAADDRRIPVPSEIRECSRPCEST